MSASTNSRRGRCPPASVMSSALSCQPRSPRESKVSVTCRASPGTARVVGQPEAQHGDFAGPEASETHGVRASRGENRIR